MKLNVKHLGICVGLTAVFGWGGAAPLWSQPTVELLRVHTIPGTAADRSPFHEDILPGTPHNQFGGISAIEWSGRGDEYWALPDRGPSDGAAYYQCRLHLLRLPLSQHTASPQAEILETRMLIDQRGLPFMGSSELFVTAGERPRRFDPEGLRLDRAGNFWISDEYGPYLICFGPDGKMLREIQIPAAFQIEQPSANAKEEDANNTKGRRSNRGMEGLAITPRGDALLGLMQSPLLQDAERDQGGKAVGWNSRLLWIDFHSGSQKQFVYRQHHPEHKMHEILAINDTEYLVIEQDGKAGSQSKFKKIIHITLAGATENDSDIILPAGDLPPAIKPVGKRDFIDLLAPEFGLAGPHMPEKIEGLCWGPTLDDGRRILVVATDNDFKAEQETMFYFFAVRVQ